MHRNRTHRDDAVTTRQLLLREHCRHRRQQRPARHRRECRDAHGHGRHNADEPPVTRSHSFRPVSLPRHHAASLNVPFCIHPGNGCGAPRGARRLEGEGSGNGEVVAAVGCSDLDGEGQAA
jgi:hypothetical protein